MEVLSREPVLATNEIYSAMLFITIVFIAISSFSLAMWATGWLHGGWLIMILIITVLSVVGLSLAPKEIRTGRTRYRVLFSDEEYLNKIEGRYVVVGKEGMITVLESVGG